MGTLAPPRERKARTEPESVADQEKGERLKRREPLSQRAAKARRPARDKERQRKRLRMGSRGPAQAQRKRKTHPVEGKAVVCKRLLGTRGLARNPNHYTTKFHTHLSGHTTRAAACLPQISLKAPSPAWP